MEQERHRLSQQQASREARPAATATTPHQQQYSFSPAPFTFMPSRQQQQQQQPGAKSVTQAHAAHIGAPQQTHNGVSSMLRTDGGKQHAPTGYSQPSFRKDAEELSQTFKHAANATFSGLLPQALRASLSINGGDTHHSTEQQPHYSGQDESRQAHILPVAPSQTRGDALQGEGQGNFRRKPQSEEGSRLAHRQNNELAVNGVNNVPSRMHGAHQLDQDGSGKTRPAVTLSARSVTLGTPQSLPVFPPVAAEGREQHQPQESFSSLASASTIHSLHHVQNARHGNASVAEPSPSPVHDATTTLATATATATATMARHGEDAETFDRNSVEGRAQSHTQGSPHSQRLHQEDPASQLKREIAEMKEELALHAEQKTMLHQKIREQEKEIEKSKMQLQTLQKHMIEQEEARTVEMLQADKELTSLKEENRVLREDKEYREDDKDEECRQLQAQVQSLQVSYTEAIQDQGEIEERLVAAERELHVEKAAVSKLQAVLGTFEEEKSAAVRGATARLKEENAQLSAAIEELTEEAASLKDGLARMKAAHRSVAAIQGDLHEREGMLASMQTENKRLKYEVSLLQGQLENARTQSETERIDRTLLVNSVRQYFTTKDSTRKKEVLAVIAEVCDFTDEEKVNAGVLRGQSGFLGNFFGSHHGHGPKPQLHRDSPKPSSALPGLSSTTPSDKGKGGGKGSQSDAGRTPANSHTISEEFVNFLLHGAQKPS